LTSADLPRSVDGEPTLFPRTPFDLRTRADVFLDDENLQGFVGEATTARDVARRDALAEMFGADVKALRHHAGLLKQHALDNLDHYLERWIERAEEVGTRVHYASDAREANQIVVDIALRNRAKLCVKSKSMVTEETHLVPDLENAGVETVETDLGEFIIQVDGDAPSHIVMPMIHKDRRSVGRAFARELGVEYTEDPETLTRIAREHLRKKYRQADLGISGGNFLVAESGSLVICTNEGNGRFCTSEPKVHVAMVGIEKIVPGFDELSLLLHLLARSATGQPLTCYTQILTGPRRASEVDGPLEMHVVLLDGGRTRILADPHYRQALRCIRCGACLNACPVYRKATGHAYGSVYSGPIGAVITPLLKGLDAYPSLPEASSLCGACNEACPVDIDLPGLLVRLRRDQRRRRAPLGEKLVMGLLATAFRSPFLYRLCARLQRVMLAVCAGGGKRVRKAPGPFAGWTRERDLPLPAKRTFRDRWRSRGRGKR